MAITVKVTTSQLEDAARRFDTGRDNCIRLVREMMGIAGSLNGTWKGEAATVYYRKLQDIQGDLNDMKNIIEEQSKDLRAMEKVYVQAEENASRQANSLDSDVLSF